MATFKVGQRVKRARFDGRCDIGMLLGDCGTVIYDDGGTFVKVRPDDCRGNPRAVGGYYRDTLEPLTDPDSKADEFIAKLKKLGPLPVKEVA